MLGGRGTITGCTYGSLTLPQIVYNKLRTSTQHEATMPDKIKITEKQVIDISGDIIHFPKQFVLGLFIAAISFECFKNERENIEIHKALNINGQSIKLKYLIGDPNIIRTLIARKT